MDTSALATLREKCGNIIQEGDGLFSWAWDDWCNAALASFEYTVEDKAWAILETHFAAAWYPKSFAFWQKGLINKAPENVRAVAEGRGGLNKDQVLFSFDAQAEGLLVGHWWPWEDGSTISVRICLFPRDPDISDDALKEKIVEWFDLELPEDED